MPQSVTSSDRPQRPTELGGAAANIPHLEHECIRKHCGHLVWDVHWTSDDPIIDVHADGRVQRSVEVCAWLAEQPRHAEHLFTWRPGLSTVKVIG